MNYLSVDDFRSFNPLLDLSAYTNTTISGMLVRVESLVDNYLGYTLNRKSVVREKASGRIDSYGDLLIFPKNKPVLSVSEIRLVKGTDTVTLVLTEGANNKYDIENNSVRYGGSELNTTGTSTLSSFWEIRRSQFFTEISYEAGYETIPDDLLSAVSNLAKNEVASNQNVGGARRVRQGGIEIEYSESGMSELEKDAYKVLDRYKNIVPF